jgi:hypothetical protein
VLVVLCVPFAFRTASLASVQARLEDDPRELGHELRLSAENAARRHADITAIQTERDARQQSLDIRLAEIRVGAGSAGLGTDEAFVDARGQNARVNRKRPRMGVQHLPSTGHDPSSRECARIIALS